MTIHLKIATSLALLAMTDYFILRKEIKPWTKNSQSKLLIVYLRNDLVFLYYRDYYALQILKEVVGNGIKISDLKKSRYAKLLNKKVVKDRLAQCGGNRLQTYQLEPAWQDGMEYFTLTLDLWNGNEDGWSQTSRRGWNLVLQLNFSNQHNSYYRKLVRPRERQALNFYCHPVFKREEAHYFRETLAWARLDIDFDKNECLVEEIQSDWIRDAKELLADAHYAKKRKQKCVKYWPVEGRLDDVISYCQCLNRQYAGIWAEAMLSAVLFFVKKELGLKQVYYHSSQSGFLVKKISGTKPPKSLYSSLPKAFCFRETFQAPEILKQETRYRRLQRKLKKIHWFELGL